METQLTYLPNGLSIVSQRMPQLGTIALGAWFFVGSSQEEESEHGISHFLEHMLFKGTTGRNSQQIVEAIENTGGYLNASTSREVTSYYSVVMKEYLPIAIDIIADIIQHPTFTESNLECEKKVVLQEIAQYRDEPEELISDYLQQQVYPDHKLGKSILGAPLTVNSLTAQDLQGYMKRYYHPSNMVLVATGAIEHDRLVSLAQKYFVDLPAAAGRQVPTIPKWHASSCIYRKQLNQTHLIVALPGLARTDAKFYAFNALLATLGGGLSSRIVKAIREDYGLSYNVQTFFHSFLRAGYAGVYLSCKHSAAAQCLSIIGREWRKAVLQLTAAEVDKAKQQLKMSYLVALERPYGLAEQIARQFFYYGRRLTTAEVMQKIDMVTLEELKQMARERFRNISVALLGEAPLDTSQALACVMDE